MRRDSVLRLRLPSSAYRVLMNQVVKEALYQNVKTEWLLAQLRDANR